MSRPGGLGYADIVRVTGPIDDENIAVSGMALYGSQEKAGPLAPLYAAATPMTSVSSVVQPAFADEGAKRGGSRAELPGGRRRGGALKAVHEFFANLTLWLVAADIARVILAGVAHRENLVRAMITGRKRADTE